MRTPKKAENNLNPQAFLPYIYKASMRMEL
jgi:hypothetical protein